jgi:hypothetical protein
MPWQTLYARHPESQYLQLRIRLNSASLNFTKWIKEKISKLVNSKGGWIENYSGVYVLSYGKIDSIKLLNWMYYPNVESYLKRKYVIAKQFLGE